MRRIITTLLVLVAIISTVSAQELLKHKWHRFYIGGDKGYFVKTNSFTATSMTENQFGSGGQFDNSPMEIKVVSIYQTADDERVITEYADSAYYILVFKNFTANKAQVCMSTEPFTTIDAAKAFVPADEMFSDWFTAAGYKAEEKKPAMPEMTKKDAIAFVTYFTNAINSIKKAQEAKSDADKEKNAFAAAMLLAVVPSKFAESKGYNAYKSLPVIDRGMNKYKNEPEIKQLLKEAGMPDNK